MPLAFNISSTGHGNLAISSCAFIKYATKEEALKVGKELAKKGIMFLGKAITIEWPREVPKENLLEKSC